MTADHFATHYTAEQTHLPGAHLAWLHDLRERGIDRYRQLGLPTPGCEEWKFTHLKRLSQKKFNLPSATTTARVSFALPHEDTLRIAFVEGRFCAAQSSQTWPQGVTVDSLAAAIDRDDATLRNDLAPYADTGALVALNSALMRDGYRLRIAPGVQVQQVIEIVHLGAQSSDLFWNSRNLIHVGAGASATILERTVDSTADSYFANSVTGVIVAEQAKLHHARFLDANRSAVIIAHTQAQVAGRYDNFFLNTGAGLARNDVTVRLGKEQATCTLNGAYMADGHQHSDMTTRVDHLVPHTTCDEVFKGVLSGQSRGVFQGKIVVHPNAQKTVGNQSNRVLLLSETAEIDAKPELEIFADDVICSHGCTSGQIDDDQLFYMQARGLNTETAQRLLVHAFLAEVVEKIHNDDLRDFFLAQIHRWLSERSEAATSA